MTHEEKKAAVLAECERQCPDFGDLYCIENNLSVERERFAWQFSGVYFDGRPSSLICIYHDMIAEDFRFEVAYRLLGLDKPPATIDRWDSFKAGLRKGIENHMELARSKMSSPRLNEWYEGSVKTCQVLLKEMDVLETGTPPPADTRWERLKAWLESTQEWFTKPKVRGEYDWSDTDKMLTSMAEVMDQIEKGEL